MNGNIIIIGIIYLINAFTGDAIQTSNTRYNGDNNNISFFFLYNKNNVSKINIQLYVPQLNNIPIIGKYLILLIIMYNIIIKKH